MTYGINRIWAPMLSQMAAAHRGNAHPRFAPCGSMSQGLQGFSATALLRTPPRTVTTRSGTICCPRIPRAPVACPGIRSSRLGVGAASTGAAEEERWTEMFAELQEYKREWGHTSVVLGSSLGRWVYRQRELKRARKLSQGRIELLESEGFQWQHPFDAMGGDWEDMFAQLMEFREAEGHCQVKKKYDKNPALGFWVNEQRIAHREGKLSEDLLLRLNDIGFQWEASKQCGSKFMIGFRDLLEYREEHGTIVVPPDDPKWSKLNAWIHAQRGAYKKGILSQKRVDYLEGIGFSWE
eukprot:CAMPEP_0117653562 /NCGR_PEP_ID=MMETSP0804-20121206/3259_1 /TAXON_ID=1074897 /ORGANISM="Tetraselmis astigmatica, Strain CCMP880" /LENGTH=294 /DNA_ID=CAMNT_0005459749 /DNA_START=40 /DNA_END=924 /DNA_ORIENTATION=-